MSWQATIRLPELTESGLAHRFETRLDGELKPAFVFLYKGEVHAFINRCPHIGVELDWAPGVVFDRDGRYLLCSTHGAQFNPASGECVAGPCAGQALSPLSVKVQQDMVYCWQA